MAEDLEEDFEEGEGSEDSSDAPKKALPIKKILIIVLPILLLLGAGAGIYFSGLLDKFMGHKGDEHHEEAADAHAPPPPKATPLVCRGSHVGTVFTVLLSSVSRSAPSSGAAPFSNDDDDEDDAHFDDTYLM